MTHNRPLIIGMSPSPCEDFQNRAFAPGATTTKALIKCLFQMTHEGNLDHVADAINLDVLNIRKGRPELDPDEAKNTLDLLYRLNCLEERAIILLGKQVCDAVEHWFAVETPFKRPSENYVVHTDGWGCLIIAVDHPSRYHHKKKAKLVTHTTLIQAALTYIESPTRQQYLDASKQDALDLMEILETEKALLEDEDERDAAQSDEAIYQARREYEALRDYYSTPLYYPDD